MKFSSPAVPEVVILTTSGTASDENFIKMMTCLFHCKQIISLVPVQLWDCASASEATLKNMGK